MSNAPTRTMSPDRERPGWFRDGSMPSRETPARKFLIHSVALIAIGVTAAYLAWRLVGTINLTWWWVAIPLFVVEVHNAFGLVLYTVALWSLDSDPPPMGTAASKSSVAILIPTYNEPLEVLLPTIAASVALRPAHETWVLDDGGRDDVRDLALKLGAKYLARSDHSHAKAGNLNNALKSLSADIVAVLDADHVPTARFLTALLPYFQDERLAFVQSPQDFYNLESFEHERRRNGAVFNEEAVFYRVIAPAKSRWSAPFWCGTCALVRVAALRSVGGVSTDSVTEDIHTTIRMYRAGWTGAYHNEVLARGLAPEDAISYMLQRNRWALGAMQVLRGENPLFGRGLSAAQRLAFLTTLFGWFDSWRTLAYIVIPLAVVGTGAVPINAPGDVFAPFFLATLGLQFVALRLLARGYYPPVLSMLFEILRMPAVLPATLALARPSRHATFRVTPKGRTASGRTRVPVPRVLSVLAAASALGLAWFTATLFGLTLITYAVPWAAIGAALFMSGNLALLLAAIGRIRSVRFAGNRRAGTRLPVHLPVRLGARAAQLADLSLTGARLIVAGRFLPRGGRTRVTLDLGRETVALTCHVRRHAKRSDGQLEVGVQFEAGQEKAIARVAVAVFHTEVTADEAPPLEERNLVWERATA
jgi:cellulose synthase/poly-beta-1,6-N-acetylglucosamine synthase-like glycosyltransferase